MLGWLGNLGLGGSIPNFILTVGTEGSSAATVDSADASFPAEVVLSSADGRTIVVGDILTDSAANDYLITVVTDQTHITVIDYKTSGSGVSPGVGTTSRSDASITNAEADIVNYASSGDTVEWRCYADGTLDDTTTFNDLTLTSTGTFKLTAPEGERHTGSAGTGFVLSSSTTGLALWFKNTFEPDTTVEFLEITGWFTTSGNDVGVDFDGPASGLIDSCIIHDAGTTPSGDGHGLILRAKAISARNCLIYDLNGASGINYGIRVISNVPHNIDNCTIERVDNGVIGVGTNVLVKNTVSINTVTIDFFGTFSASSTNNADSDGTAPGSNDQNNLTAADEFVDLTNGSEDYRTKAGGNLRDNGADLTSSFVLDIVSAKRRVPYDIGAFQFNSGGGGDPFSLNVASTTLGIGI